MAAATVLVGLAGAAALAASATGGGSQGPTTGASAGTAAGMATTSTLYGSSAAPAESPAALPTTPPPMQIGMNLGGLDLWGATFAFADLVQGSGTLMSMAGGWARLDEPGTPIALDASGRPGSLPAGAALATMVLRGAPAGPVGNYACRVSPGWRVQPFGNYWKLKGSGDAPSSRFGMELVNPTSSADVTIVTVATRSGARLDTLSCRMAGVPENDPFNPVFLNEHRPYRVLRFMDWMRANHAGHRTWATRTTPASFTQSRYEGASVEMMVALANRLDADPWFTLPLDADPDYYRRFAEYVRDNLSPGRRAYVELSNEVWNDGFPQAKLAREQGLRRYPNSSPDEAADFYYADRTIELMDEWSRVFAGRTERIVRVIANQAGWVGRIERMLAHNNAAGHVDALATAPYFGNDGSRYPGTGPAKVDALFADGPRVVGEAIGQAVQARAVAQRYRLRYVSYEGGPGYFSYQPALQKDLMAAHDDPRMETLYRSFLTRWKREVGDLFVPYTSVHGGAWGHRAYTGQPLAQAPSARAVLEPAWGARTN